MLYSGFAVATTVGECTTAIATVAGDLAGVEIGGRNPDRTVQSLESKLDGATLKLQQGKFNDALQKLIDFQGKIEDLVAQGKISDGEVTTVQELQEDTMAAVECVSNLIGSS